MSKTFLYKFWYFLLAFLIIILDQMSKIWVLTEYSPYQAVTVLPMFNITLAYNTGSAFSFLSETGSWHQWFFIGFSVLMSAILVIWMLRSDKTQRLQQIGLALILGGAIGNLIDRLRLGYVIDFIDIFYNQHHWPVFNLADSAICIGAILLVLEFMHPHAKSINQSL